MSNIIRSQELSEAGCAEVALGAPITDSPDPHRPPGGLRWLQRDAQPVQPRPHSEFERRKLREQQLREDAERNQQRGYHEGFVQGETAGRKLAAQTIEPILQSLRTLIESLTLDKEALINRHEGELIQIAFLIATGVLHREIETNDETILAVAQAALAKVVKANHVLLKVSPYDLEMVQRLMSDTDAPPDWLPPTVKLEADMSIGRGGCKVVTDSGEIDATIETQLHLIKAIAWSD